MLLWNQYRCSLENIAKNSEHIQTTKTEPPHPHPTPQDKHIGVKLWRCRNYKLIF